MASDRDGGAMKVGSRSRYGDAEAFVTKYGAIVRELMHPSAQASRNQSLAEAIVPVGATTCLHRHHKCEEIYHIVSGRGRMTLGPETFDVAVGDSICIAPGMPHRIANTGTTELRILCACAPAYAHEDTELLGT